MSPAAFQVRAYCREHGIDVTLAEIGRSTGLSLTQVTAALDELQAIASNTAGPGRDPALHGGGE